MHFVSMVPQKSNARKIFVECLSSHSSISGVFFELSQLQVCNNTVLANVQCVDITKTQQLPKTTLIKNSQIQCMKDMDIYIVLMHTITLCYICAPFLGKPIIFLFFYFMHIHAKTSEKIIVCKQSHLRLGRLANLYLEYCFCVLCELLEAFALLCFQKTENKSCKKNSTSFLENWVSIICYEVIRKQNKTLG